MKKSFQNPREERICAVLRHVGYLSNVISDLEKDSDHRGIVEVDGRLRQSISGRWRLQKNEIDHILRLCDLYGLIKFDSRTKLAKILR